LVKGKSEFEFPPELYYDRTHNWARVEREVVVQGMTAFGQRLAGEIVYVEPAVAGRKVKQGQPVFSIESGKWVGRINAAVGGEVIAFNIELDAQPDLVNKEPYGRGWMVRIRPDSLEADLARLARPDEEYMEFILSERKRYGI
jgi:glycine cleavage system H protein